MAKQPRSWWLVEGEIRLLKRYDKVAVGGEQVIGPYDEESCGDCCVVRSRGGINDLAPTPGSSPASASPSTGLVHDMNPAALWMRHGTCDATENSPVLIVSHRLLIGAVAALHRGYRHPADIFGHASDFHLAPAQLWATPLRETT